MVNTLSGVNGLSGGYAASPFGRLSALRASDRTGLDPVLFVIEEAALLLLQEVEGRWLESKELNVSRISWNLTKERPMGALSFFGIGQASVDRVTLALPSAEIAAF